jgi:hypothetical protein
VVHYRRGYCPAECDQTWIPDACAGARAQSEAEAKLCDITANMARFFNPDDLIGHCDDPANCLDGPVFMHSQTRFPGHANTCCCSNKWRSCVPRRRGGGGNPEPAGDGGITRHEGGGATRGGGVGPGPGGGTTPSPTGGITPGGPGAWKRRCAGGEGDSNGGCGSVESDGDGGVASL